MIALLAAASVTTAVVPPTPQAAVTFDMPVAIAGRACGMWDATPVRRTVPTPALKRLSELPPANLELAVLRLDSDGCSKPVIVRYNAEGDGRFAKPSK